MSTKKQETPDWEAVRQRLEALGYRVRPLSEGRAVVKKDRKWGFVDAAGTEVVPLRYDFALFFREGRAVVELNGKFGYVDLAGNEVVPLIYNDAWPFHKGRAMVMKDGEQFWISPDGDRLD